MTAVCLQMYKHPNVFVFSFTLKMVCNFHLERSKEAILQKNMYTTQAKLIYEHHKALCMNHFKAWISSFSVCKPRLP